MRIGLAALPFPTSLEDAVQHVKQTLEKASSKEVQIVCTPENYLPGMRGVGHRVDSVTDQALFDAHRAVGMHVRNSGVALILGTEFPTAEGRFASALVFDRSGAEVGRQDKVQLDPDEDDLFLVGTARSIFEIDGVKFGIAICHEASHYPETVRWAALNGAKVVFHPQFSPPTAWGGRPRRWADQRNSFHEKAFICRAVENGIYFATANYALEVSRTTSAVINPDGSLLARLPYGDAGLLIVDLKPEAAAAKFTKRYRPLPEVQSLLSAKVPIVHPPEHRPGDQSVIWRVNHAAQRAPRGTSTSD